MSALQGATVGSEVWRLSQQQTQDRVTKLREELCAAEVEKSLAKVVNTANVIYGYRR